MLHTQPVIPSENEANFARACKVLQTLQAAPLKSAESQQQRGFRLDFKRSDKGQAKDRQSRQYSLIEESCIFIQ
jgi:hypothetical protein